MVALGAKSALALLSFALVQPIIKRFNANERLDKQEQVDLYNYQVQICLPHLKKAWKHRVETDGLGRVKFAEFARTCDTIRLWSCVVGVAYLRKHCTNTLAQVQEDGHRYVHHSQAPDARATEAGRRTGPRGHDHRGPHRRRGEVLRLLRRLARPQALQCLHVQVPPGGGERREGDRPVHVVLCAQSVWNYQSLFERDDSSLSSTQVLEFHVFEGLRPMRRRDKSWPWWPYPVPGSAQIKFHGAFALNRLVDGPVDLHATDTTSA